MILLEFFKWVSVALTSILGLWLAARVVTAAYFKSKQEHEATERKPHDERP